MQIGARKNKVLAQYRERWNCKEL